MMDIITYSKVSKLAKDFDGIATDEGVYGKNRWDISKYTTGYLKSDGTINASDSWRTTDYCYVEGFSDIIGSVRNALNVQANLSLFFLCTYDKNKNFIEQKWATGSYTASLNSNVAYVRFSYSAFDYTEYMLEEGTTKTAYEPFVVTSKNVVKTDSTLTDKTLPANAKAVGDLIYNPTDVMKYEPCTLTMTGEKLLNASTGAITTSSGHTEWKVSDYIDIENNPRVMVTTEQFYGQGVYAFYKGDKTFISGEASASGSTVTTLWNKIVDKPANAKYIVIGYLYQATMEEPFLFKGVPQSSLPSKRWYGKKWTCLGDSLTANNSKTSLHYFDYISGATGISVVNLGVSGSGYAKSDNNFMAKALTVPTDSDVVTIFGSGNDASAGLQLGTATDTGTTTIAGTINTTIDNLYSIMPVVQLGIITPTPWQNNMPSDNGWMENYSDLIVDICKLRSIPCLDLFHCSNLNPNSESVREQAYSKDEGNGVHPDETGHKIIASRIKAFLDSLII